MSVGMIQILGTTTGGTENGIASIDIPDDGRILEASMFASVDLDTDLESFAAEVSFLATNQVGTNDARGILIGARVSASVGAVGALAARPNTRIDYRPGLPVQAGERLHLHGVCGSGVVAIVCCQVVFDFLSGRTARMRRR